MSKEEFAKALEAIRNNPSKDKEYGLALDKLKEYAKELFSTIQSSAIGDKIPSSKDIVDKTAKALSDDLSKEFPSMKIILSNSASSETHRNNLGCQVVLGKHQLWLSEVDGRIYVCVESLELSYNRK